jgi:hypothetical protein
MMTQAELAAIAAAPEPRRGLLGRRWWKLWLLIVELCLIAGVVAADQRPYWQLQAINFDGPEEWAEQARACVVWPVDSNYLHVAVDSIQARLQKTFGSRADVRVKLTLPAAITMSIVPTTPSLWVSARKGLLTDGALLTNPIAQPSQPYWHRLGRAGTQSSARADTLASGLWSSILSVDERFGQIASEWRYDIKKGWTVIAADGRTRIILGHANVRERAGRVAALLSQSDVLQAGTVIIDARFPDQVIVRQLKTKNGKTYSNAARRSMNTQSALLRTEEGKGA